MGGKWGFSIAAGNVNVKASERDTMQGPRERERSGRRKKRWGLRNKILDF